MVTSKAPPVPSVPMNNPWILPLVAYGSLLAVVVFVFALTRKFHWFARAVLIIVALLCAIPLVSALCWKFVIIDM